MADFVDSGPNRINQVAACKPAVSMTRGERCSPLLEGDKPEKENCSWIRDEGQLEPSTGEAEVY